MADTIPSPADSDHLAPSLNLQRVYLKDLSLEMPNAPQIFLDLDSPHVEVNIQIGGQRLNATLFESTITVTLTTRINDKVLYLIEGTQAGIFELLQIPEEQVNPLLGIACPTMLYPYLRANIADAITRTSLPTLHLVEMNFQALYEQRHGELFQQQAAADADTDIDTSDLNPTAHVTH
jgi:preprotein translocase subunit SecB